MRVASRQRLIAAISLFAIVAPVFANPFPLDSQNEVVDPDPVAKSSIRGKAVGTEHAPVDGKDGIPHAGPWIETSAERERKKTQSPVGEDEDDSDSYTSISKLHDIKADLSDSKIPQSNEGVMDDKSRAGPVDGTRGTEGGISHKSKDTAIGGQKRPDTPKEQPPLPHSEKEKMEATDKSDFTKAVLEDDVRKPLGRPTDLPEKPHAAPVPGIDIPSKGNTVPADDSKLHNHPSAGRPDAQQSLDKADIVQPLHSLFLAFTMILVSEIGDKTFLVACLMAMRHDRLLVFSAAYSALVAMTILSAVLGHAVPTLIPKWLTNFLAAGLFLVFGVKMLIEARNISPDEGVSEEMKEVEQELEEKEHEALRRSRRRSSISPYVLESGRGGVRKSRADTGRLPSPPDSPISESSSRSTSPSRHSTLANFSAGVHNLFSLLLSPAWVQTFVMTFLGEWGDRSQIATIAMAAGSDYWWVTAGAMGGHAICTGVAVLGGKAIAGKVSLRTVTMGGAVAFLVFGVVYLLEAIY